jgi:hypothetical protein
MTLAPRAVVIHRTTELDELLAHHGTRGQAAFFLTTRNRSIDDVVARHVAADAALATVSAAIPIDWRRGAVERADLARFLFAPDDVIIVVGQDGLVANVAKYLDGQPVIGINTDTVRNPGVLVAHQPGDLAELLRSRDHFEVRTMVEAITDDGQELRALNEIYLGHPSHQTARYTITPPDAPAEPQASSGLIVATGTGATGWCRSVWLEHHSTLTLPQPTDPRLAWFVREAWPSPVTGTSCTEGELTDSGLAITIESEHLVLFGDGIETDNIGLTSGQRVIIRRAQSVLRLVR